MRRGAFDDEEFEQPSQQRDTELTLGAGTLLLLFFALVAVCGLCFGLGYAVGHRAAASAATNAAQPAAGNQASGQSVSSMQKPSATAPAAPSSPTDAQANTQPQAGTSDLPQSTAAVAVPVGSSQGGSVAAQNPPNVAQPQVRPALPAMSSPAQPAPAASAQQVQPAGLPSGNALWVQIAAVSHVEDAKVLTDALRKHGYEVTPRREPSDNMIHVRIGPFSSRDEANRWRMKLLNDGYNAEVQP